MTPAAAAVPARHDLLAVEAADWPAVAGTLRGGPALSPAGAALVRDWGRAGRPVIARRSQPGDPPGAVPVGLPLPPSCGKARVALAVPAGVPWRPVAPVPLAAAASAAPEAWRATIDALLGLALALGLAPRVFGALLWQVATGLGYLGPASDLDLLWRAEEAGSVGRLLDGLESIAAGAPMPLDGEVLTVAGGVQWRDLALARRHGGTVLAKSLDRAGLVPVDAVLRPDVARWP